MYLILCYNFLEWATGYSKCHSDITKGNIHCMELCLAKEGRSFVYHFHHLTKQCLNFLKYIYSAAKVTRVVKEKGRNSIQLQLIQMSALGLTTKCGLGHSSLSVQCVLPNVEAHLPNSRRNAEFLPFRRITFDKHCVNLHCHPEM